MTKVTKKSKVTKFFNKNPTATVKEAATATGVSYNTAWTVRKDIQAIADEAIGLPSRKDFDKWLHRDDKTSSVVRSKNYVPKPQVTTTQSLVIDQAHSTPLVVGKLADNAQQESIMQGLAAVSDGSTAKYYELPDGAKELQDLISHKNMNSQIGEIFRAAYRYGESSHSNELRDAKKIKFYIDAEIKRLGG
jgi:hypothetical protein